MSAVHGAWSTRRDERSWRLPRRRLGRLGRAQQAQDVAAPDLLKVGFGVTLGQQALADLPVAGGVVEARDPAAAVEVQADADMVDAGHLQGVVEMVHEILEGGLA